MSSEMSKSQIDRLGDRLKKGIISEDNLRLLDSYRRSFTEAYELVIGAIRTELALEPTGRPAKSTTSISEKLRREYPLDADSRHRRLQVNRFQYCQPGFRRSTS